MGISFKNWPFQAIGLTYFSETFDIKKWILTYVCCWKQFFGNLKFDLVNTTLVLSWLKLEISKLVFAIYISESIRGKPKCLEKELSSSQYSKANSTNSMVYQDIFMTCQPRYWNTVKLISELIILLLICSLMCCCICTRQILIYCFICKSSPCQGLSCRTDQHHLADFPGN